MFSSRKYPSSKFINLLQRLLACFYSSKELQIKRLTQFYVVHIYAQL